MNIVTRELGRLSRKHYFHHCVAGITSEWNQRAGTRKLRAGPGGRDDRVVQVLQVTENDLVARCQCLREWHEICRRVWWKTSSLAVRIPCCPAGCGHRQRPSSGPVRTLVGTPRSFGSRVDGECTTSSGGSRVRPGVDTIKSLIAVTSLRCSLVTAVEDEVMDRA